MAGRTPLLAALVVLAMSAAACSSGGAEVTLPGPTSSSSTTEAPPPSVTTTTEATTTTLSEQALAEAEVEQLVIDYWLSPFDTSKGEAGLEYITGLLALRSEAAIESVTAAGQISRNLGQERIEITGVEVDLEIGQAEINACTGASGERVDAETLERIGEPDDPDYLTTTTFFVQLSHEGWKITELIGSAATASPELCEIEVEP